jgi:cytochrome c biogenesis protein CcmG/thiol:disulfide interchange protein DsbE
LELARDPRIELVGINYKDKTPNALSFLGELGNPFAQPSGSTQPAGGNRLGRLRHTQRPIWWAPDGTILFKQIGPFTPESLRDKLLAGD